MCGEPECAEDTFKFQCCLSMFGVDSDEKKTARQDLRNPNSEKPVANINAEEWPSSL